MLERIEAVLAETGDDFREFTSVSNPPTVDEVDKLEADLGRELPADYRAFILKWGVMILDVKEDIWPRPQAYEIRPRWQMEFARFVHGLAQRTPPIFLVREASAAMASEVPGFLPILRAPGSPVVEGYDANGDWARWDGTSLAKTDHGSFIDAVVASFEQLMADRKRLETEPIAVAD